MVTINQNLRERLFPGKSRSEIILNEIDDFLISGLHRKEFLLMAGYSAILIFVVFYSSEARSHYIFSINIIALVFAILGVYFIASDFIKRKKLFGLRPMFIIDSVFYSAIMFSLIYMTGGYSSVVGFPLLFLMTISSPLYGTLKETLIFVIIVALFYSIFPIFSGQELTEALIHFFEAITLIVATVIVKVSLNVSEKKTAEYLELSLKNQKLYEELADYNKKLTNAVEEKTVELVDSLKKTALNENNLERQKLATLNILEDMNDERARTLAEKEKLSMILQSIGDGVFVVDHHKNISIFNHVSEEISGFKSGEVIGRPYKDFMRFASEKDRSDVDVVAKVFETGEIKEMANHTVLVKKDGRDVAVEDSAAPIFNKEGKVHGCVVVFRDVTKEREIDRQKSEFVSVASHQLRTPLTSIRWFLEMLMNGDAGALNDEQKDYVKQVSESGERMIELVNKLLNVSRIESGRVKLEPKPVDLRLMIDSIGRELEPLFKNRKIIFNDKSGKLPIINLDEKLVREVFVNLISNSIKYGNVGSKVLLGAEIKDENIIFRVVDNGIGIPKKEQFKIFGKFFRAENAVVSETEGSGMGLYVCKSIVEMSGGRMWFESEENKGTSFFFTLPLAGSKEIVGERSLEATKIK